MSSESRPEPLRTMTERPLLFSAPMVRALLAGTKTQTRRVVKLPKWMKARGGNLEASSTFRDPGFGDGEYLHVALDDETVHRVRCPYADTPGNRLWVKETFAGSIAYERHGYPLREWGNKLWYVADGEPRSGQWTRPKPSIHMPRVLSRITLEVTGVRVERLQAISEADAWAEGCIPGELDDYGNPFPAEEKVRDGVMRGWDCARDWYADLWDEINGEDAFEANPWVWVVEFRRC